MLLLIILKHYFGFDTNALQIKKLRLYEFDNPYPIRSISPSNKLERYKLILRASRNK